MLKKKEELFEEVKKLGDVGSNIYVGKISEIKKDNFDMDNLFVADLVRPTYMPGNPEPVWTKMVFKYVFEKVQYGEMLFYREIFSGATIEPFVSSKLLDKCGIYVTDPVLFEEYAVSVLGTGKNQVNDNPLVRVRTIN